MPENSIKDFVIRMYSDNILTAAESKERCYVNLLTYLKRIGYSICGCRKTKEGNSHDDDWQDCYTVVGDGGPFKGMFEKVKQRMASTYECKPALEHIEALTA